METIRIKARSGSAGTAPVSIKAPSGSAGTAPASIKALSGSAGTASLSRPIKALSGSAGTAPASIKARSGSAGIPSAHRSAFTLVELLVVIGIIALLAAIVTPAVMRAQTTARNAAIRAEIAMLHMAIMNYKTEYGSFPPCKSEAGQTGLAATHVKRLFPRSTPTPDSRTPDNAIVRWLRGYTSNPLDPFGSGGEKREKLFDFDISRVTSLDQYYPSGKSGSPYIYINSNEYVWDHDSNPTSAKVVQEFSLTGGTYFAHRVPTSATGAFNNIAQPAFNDDTFQILSAGRDEEFGTEDDLSNFWPGTRGDYLDSLKQ